MRTDNLAKISQPISIQSDLVIKVQRLALAVPVLALLMGATAMTLELRFGLLAAALILGWTQLVGL